MGKPRWWVMLLLGMASMTVFGAPTPAFSHSSATPGVSLARTADHLRLRANASTLVRPLGLLSKGAAIAVSCQVRGESVDSSSGTSPWWDRLSGGQFVSDAYVRWPFGRPNIPWCSFAGAAAPPSGEPFVQWAAPFARQTKATHQVPAAVTLAQAILESGWGRSALTVDGNSFFGMKCFGGPGLVATGCRPYQTQECDWNSCFSTKASFRVYDTVQASFVDHAQALASLSRYRSAFRYAGDADMFAVTIAKAGYATSPTYAQDLIGLMRQFNLYRFDRA